MSVIMVASKSVIAQSIETMGGPKALDQLQVGGHPEEIAVNTATNKIYILDPENGLVTVLDSESGTVKNIHVGFGENCPYCIGVDSVNNKIYVANTVSDSVSVIDGNSDTVNKTIPLGTDPTFILVKFFGYKACCKIYVASDYAVSVIDGNNDTVNKTIPLGTNPTFILAGYPTDDTYVASDNAVYVIDDTDTLSKTITLQLPPYSLFNPTIWTPAIANNTIGIRLFIYGSIQDGVDHRINQFQLNI